MSVPAQTEQDSRAAEAAVLAAAGLSRYTWNPVTATFTDTVTGRVVAPTAIRSALDDAIDASARDVRAITQQLRTGAIDLQDWQRLMMAEIKASQLAGVAAAAGGFENMTPATNGRAGRSIRDQYSYLRRLAGQIADGTQPLDGVLLRRSVMYVEAARKAHEAQRRAEMRQRGTTEHRSVTHATDSCEECLALEALEWVDIETTIPLPGDRICHSGCKCTIAYR